VVEASVDELDEMYSLVEALMDGTRSRRRLEQLEGMRDLVHVDRHGSSASISGTSRGCRLHAVLIAA
jgi:hypothetical protein